MLRDAVAAGATISGRAQIGHEKGLVHYLQVHVLDFKTGHDALFRTTQLVRQQRAKANSERSITNRPDF